MNLPKRFALSTLLVSMLVVASIFGFLQWHRQWLITEVQSLSKEEVIGLSVDDGILWPEVSPYVTLDVFYSKELNELYFGLEEQSLEEVNENIVALTGRLKAVGVTHVAWAFRDLDDPTSSAVDFTGDADYVNKRVGGGP